MSVALTTVENPFNPITEFERWYSTDLQLAVKMNRRDTCSLLALLSRTSPYFSEEENERELEETINRIILNDPLNVYKKVKQWNKSKTF